VNTEQSATGDVWDAWNAKRDTPFYRIRRGFATVDGSGWVVASKTYTAKKKVTL
jgi:hypothetical protein